MKEILLFSPIQSLPFRPLVVWTKAPPLTAVSLLPVFESRPGHVRKLPVT